MASSATTTASEPHRTENTKITYTKFASTMKKYYCCTCWHSETYQKHLKILGFRVVSRNELSRNEPGVS